MKHIKFKKLNNLKLLPRNLLAMVKTLMKRVIQSDIVMIEIDAMILDVQEILKTLLLKT